MGRFKRSMLEYCKMILDKLSFDPKLFRKEYRKSFKYLSPGEDLVLKKWARENFKLNNRSATITRVTQKS